MRNLRLISCQHVPPVERESHARCLSVDCDTGHVYIATETGLKATDPLTREVVHETELDDSSCSGHVVDIQYLGDTMQLCFASSGGDLCTWDTTVNTIECVGSVQSGVHSMSWSPDQQLVVLATGQQTVIVMTRDFEPVHEQSLQQSQFGQAEFVTVGWGKKETQFHGSEGKGAASRREQPVSTAATWDDRRVRVSWRGDGQYFAVSTISQDTDARKFRVFTREGQLHSTSENLDGLEQCLCWRPSGNLITSSQLLPNKQRSIVFFEKNGLRHGEFNLPFGTDLAMVREVAWNLESTVLTTWVDVTTGTDQSSLETYILLWTANNYHWYQKQTLHFPGNQQVVAMEWDPEHAYRLHVLCASGEYLQYTWSWCTDHSQGRTSNDSATVAVIDGIKTLVTPFNQMVVPPPMCAYELIAPAAVNQIIFAPPSRGRDILLLLVDGRMALYSFHSDDKSIDDGTVRCVAAGGAGFAVKCSTPCLQKVYSVKFSEVLLSTSWPLFIHQVSWVAVDTIIFTCMCGEGSGPLLHVGKMDSISGEIIVSSSLSLEGAYIMASTLCPDGNSVAIQTGDGTVLKYELGSDFMLPWETSSGDELQLPQPCPQMAVCRFDGELAVLGLTERYRFYVNALEVASNCTSFCVHDEFLLLTTHAHTCRCVSLSTRLNVLPTLTDGKAHPFDESVRRVERGSRIVAAVRDDTKLVLQMPRGNLETIHPRALVLSCVRKHLDRCQYGEAFSVMKKHRINLNLIYDHNPAAFVDHARLFVDQIASVTHINLFLTSLQEEDVTQTMYTAAYKQVTPSVGEKPSKVDRVCDVVKSTLECIDTDRYLLCILTAHVKKSSPELEVALERIKCLKDRGVDSHVTAEEALRYLLFLVDVNELYDVALGTYDFDLVMMVAEKSQKDPKEYVPFLNSLRKLESDYQHYTIDKYLKRYQRALASIAKCGNEHFTECMELIQAQELYSQALTLFPKTSGQYKEIACAYGEHLLNKKLPAEAAIVFNKAEDYQRALEAYDKCHNWRMVFVMARKLNYSPDKEAELARQMINYYKEHQRHLEAACILEQYLQDYEESISTLIKGRMWEEALRLMYKYERTDFLETDFLPALHECWASEVEVLDGNRETFLKYTARLDIVRQEKDKERLELLEGGGGYNDADADLYSDASSATGDSVMSSQYSSQSQSSNYSRSTGRSSKNRRKLEKKKRRLKEGSKYEDLALVEALNKIITTTLQYKDDIMTLCGMLASFDLDTKASSLQTKLEEISHLFEVHIPNIWNESLTDGSSLQPVTGPESTTNSIVQAMQKGARPNQRQEPQLDAALRIPPSIPKSSNWKLTIL